TLMAQAFSPEGRKLSDKEREQMRETIRAEMDKLTESQRREVWRSGSAGPRRMMTERVDRYFELPASERQAYLDQQIREMEAMRQRFARNGDRQGGPPGGRFGRGPRDGREGRNGEVSRRRQMLDNTTPEQRAKFSQYFEAMSQRRKELGLPAFAGPRF
ncbi:MAG TPA: hypothetical protein VIY86_09720, partial [Pirellulaceae bacterium]